VAASNGAGTANRYAQLLLRGQMLDSNGRRASRDCALRRIGALIAPKPL
jgi:hypothetical protein